MCLDLTHSLWTLTIKGALRWKDKMGRVVQCLFQLPEDARRVKGNQISSIKHGLCQGTSQRWRSDPGNPFSTSLYLPSRRPISSSVVIREVSRGNRHHYSLASDRLKVTTSKFCKFPLAARLAGLPIRRQSERHSFTVSTCILLNSSAGHVMCSPAFCGSSSPVEHI